MSISIFRRSWRAAAVSEVGGSHIQTGVPCQDASGLSVFPNALIGCVADGAGSARYSDEGSLAAVAAFLEVSADLIHRGYDPEQVVRDAFREARRAVSEIAGSESREFATTLLGLVATKNHVAAGQIGDGAIIIDGGIALESHAGEYANETSFITEDEVVPNIYVSKKRVKRAAIITDGLEHLALHRRGQVRLVHEPFFDPMYQWLKKTGEPERVEQLSAFLRSERIRSRTGDDVTLLLAMR